MKENKIKVLRKKRYDPVADRWYWHGYLTSSLKEVEKYLKRGYKIYKEI